MRYLTVCLTALVIGIFTIAVSGSEAVAAELWLAIWLLDAATMNRFVTAIRPKLRISTAQSLSS